jgi:hypothetical protein
MLGLGLVIDAAIMVAVLWNQSPLQAMAQTATP